MSGIRVVIVCAVAASAALPFWACGGTETQPASPGQGPQGGLVGRSADDQSRCDFKGRDDREVVETAGPGAIQPNIRRVYAIVGEGDDRRKALMCREVDTNLDGVKDIVRTYNDKGEALHELADANYDGKVDTWVTFARGRISKVQVDNDGDARPDETRVYAGGRLSRIERDSNFDGKSDTWEIYENGRLRRMGVDLDGDGHVDRWNRDEMLERVADEREQEQPAPAAQEPESSEAAPQDAGVTDARVSARKR